MSQLCSIERGMQAGINSCARLGLDAEEAMLVIEARLGHPTALGDLLERHARRIHRMALRITRNREDAEDAVQECFKNAFAHFDSFRGHARFSTWLTHIAMNCALMKIRARRHRVVPLDDYIESLTEVTHRGVFRSSANPEECYWHGELETIVAEEISGLKPSFRRALHLCDLEGLTVQDAARALGISSSAVKGRVRRARLALRAKLHHRGIGRRPWSNRRTIRCELWTGLKELQGIRRRPDFGI